MAFGFTATVQAGKMSSQTGFVWVAKTANFPTAAVDGGATSLLNGGGDLRAYTDSSKATQLPLDVVELVTGGSPSVIVFGRSPTLNVASTVYFERDDAAVTQPPATDTYGRNSVYADYTHKLDAGALTDTTGATTVSLTTGATQSGLVNGFDAIDIDGSQNACAVFDSTSGENWTSDFTASAWVNLDTFPSFATILGIRESSLWEFHFRCEGNQPAILIGSASPNSTANLSSATDYYLAVTVSGTSIAFYVNGAPAGTASVSGSRSNRSFDLTTGGLKNSSTTDTSIDGRIAESRAINGTALSASRILDEYTNQSDPSTFWSSSAWEDSAGGNSASVDYSIAKPVFSSTAESVKPEFNSSIDIDISKPEFSVSAATSFTINALVDFDINKPVFSVDATTTEPEFNSDVGVQISKPVFSSTAETIKPEFNSDVDLNISEPAFSVSASSLFLIQSTVDFDVNQPVFSAIAETVKPEFNSNIDFDLDSPLFSVSAENITNESNADALITIQKPTFSATAESTKPEFNSTVDATISAPIFNATVINGIITLQFNEETNFNQPHLSTNVNQVSLSTNVDQPYLSTNIDRN